MSEHQEYRQEQEQEQETAPAPPPPPAPKPKSVEQSEKEDLIARTKADALTPDQKHQNYLEDIERLHNEP